MAYSLTVPSLSLAGLLTMWANQAGVAFVHNQHTTLGKRVRRVPSGSPTVFTFATAGELDRFLAIAENKIARLETSARRRPNAPAPASVAAALRAAFNAISGGSCSQNQGGNSGNITPHSS